MLEAGPWRSRPSISCSLLPEEVATPQVTLPGDRRLLLKQVGDAYNSLGNALSALPGISSSRGERSTWTSTGTTTQFHQQRVAELKQ